MEATFFFTLVVVIMDALHKPLVFFPLHRERKWKERERKWRARESKSKESEREQKKRARDSERAKE